MLNLFLRTVDVLGLQTLRPPLYLKLNLRAFLKRPVAGHLDGREVDKNIFATGALDKSIALRGVKPFHNTLFSHYLILLFKPLFTRAAPVKRLNVRSKLRLFSHGIFLHRNQGNHINELYCGGLRSKLKVDEKELILCENN